MKRLAIALLALLLIAPSTLAQRHSSRRRPAPVVKPAVKTMPPRSPATRPAVAPPAAAARESAATSKPQKELAPWRLVRDNWKWADAMKKVTKGFTGTPGVVLHIGDSMTYSASYSRWPRKGKSQNEFFKMTLQWMHTDAQDDTDGWYLAAHDVEKDGKALGRSYTAASAMRLDQALAGGYHGLPSIRDLLAKYNPQIVVLMLGTSDAMADRPADTYKADMAKAVQQILDNNTIPVLTTIPPNIDKMSLVRQYNEAIVEIARERKLPLIDLYGEILARQPGTAWNGTLITRNGPLLSAKVGDADTTSDPSDKNLKRSGYLLRGFLTVTKITQVKMDVID